MKRVVVEILAFASLAHGQTAPHHPPLRVPASDGTYKYYLGESNECLPDRDAYRDALNDAYEKATRENFGVTTEFQSEMTSTLQDTTSVRQVDEKTRQVQIKKFEALDSSISPCKNGGLNVRALYRYKISAINEEKRRLASIKSEPESVMSVLGAQEDVNRGTLEVLTNPYGAKVVIDGESWGRSPIKLIGQLSFGRHHLILDHPQYETEEFDVTIAPSHLSHIEKKLVRAMALLKVTTNVKNASVMINGAPYVCVDENGMKLPTGIPLHVSASHPDAFSASRDLILEKGETRTLDLPLELRPGTVTLRCPKGGEVDISDVKTADCLGETPVKLTLAPGDYDIVVSKDGFQTQSRSITLLPDGSQHLGAFRLAKTPEVLTPRDSSQGNFLSFLWPETRRVGFFLSYNYRMPTINSPYAQNFGSLELSLETNLIWKIGLVAAGSLDFGDSNNPSTAASSNFNMNGLTWRAGLPFYLSESFYFEPEYGSVCQTYSSSSFNEPFNFSVTQNFWGAIAGYRWSGATLHYDLSVGVRQYSNAGPVNGMTSPDIGFGIGYFF